MPAALPPLGIAVLALLCERPMHPYELRQVLRERHEDELVRLTTGSLYRMVDRLVSEELAEVHQSAVREGHRPERTVYAVTSKGRKALTRAVTEGLRSPTPEYPLFPLLLGEAHVLDVAAVTTELTARRAALFARERYASTALARALADGIAERHLLAVDYLAHQLRADIAWIDVLLHRLTTDDLAWQDAVAPSTSPSAGPAST